ncbi:tetrapyrrole-binding protein, chloroplastic-like [Miscanthus floridulus]|uniref:tetrapyrrole-binding protein, chloroplastic-like n=1 Tax=Miscanthus floridulus TaxID=154761 RepID=UPI003459CF00
MANASLQSFLLPQHHSFASTGGSHDGSPSTLLKLSTNTSGSISFRLHPNTSRSVTTTSTTNSSAPTPVAPATSAAEEDSSPAPSLDLLGRQLAAGDYRQADETTRALIIDLAGESARRRGYVFFSEVQFISAEDLHAIDELWKEHSNGKFGYSVQRRLWEKSQRDFTRFFIRVGWMKKLDTEVQQYNYRAFPDEFMWKMKDDTPEGHLPLTNALRGTQLLGNILTHPAFQEENQEDEAAAAAESATTGQTKDDNKGRERPKFMRDFKPDYSF